eukprot:12429816-Karenia_brevis.AAC.1
MSRHAHTWRLLDLISMVEASLFTIDTGSEAAIAHQAGAQVIAAVPHARTCEMQGTASDHKKSSSTPGGSKE